jgi:diguanylate cyclase (GGDEF)-like protein/PAS domain S-box-containing protein
MAYLMQHKRLIIQHTLLSLTFVLIILLLNRPEVIFLAKLGSVAWYPANGVAMALMLSISPWYALLLAFSDILAGSLIYHQPMASFGQTIGAIGTAVCYGGAAYVLRNQLRIDPGLSRGRDVVRYVLVTFAAVIGNTAIGVWCLAADHSIAGHEVWPAAFSWAVDDGIGVVGVAPFLLLSVFPWIRRHLLFEVPASEVRADRVRKPRVIHVGALLEGLGQAASLPLLLWIMFGDRWGYLQLFYLSFIPILWMGMRQGIRRVSTGILVLNFGIVLAMHLYPPVSSLLSKAGLLMLVVSASGLIVGATVTERHYLGSQLHERTTYLNSLIENSPLGIVVLDSAGRVELVNQAFTVLSLYNQNELVGNNLDSMFQADTNGDMLPWSPQGFPGQTVQAAVRRRRKDGKVLDLELHAVPLVVGGQIRGAYTIYRDISDQIKASQAEREHAKSLSRLVRELEVQTDQMTLLNDMAGLLECCSTTKEACAVVAQSAPKLFAEDPSGTLYTFKQSRNLIEASASWGNSKVPESVYSPETCWALRRGRAHWSDTGKGGVCCSHFPATPPAHHLCIPMMGQGETIGVLHIEFPFVPDGASDLRYSQQRLATTVAGQIALSLASLQLREKLRDQSIRDPLTGLFNRRFMQESLDREMIRARRKSHPLSVLFIDLDNFKRFNDTFGHDAGDLVLRSVADLLRGFFRGDDVTCRCGGEEFAVILPESSGRNAAARAEVLREEIKKLKLQYGGLTLDPVTTSIGVASFPEHAFNPEDLLKTADQCLYQSKAAGRNCVTVAVAQPV